GVLPPVAQGGQPRIQLQATGEHFAQEGTHVHWSSLARGFVRIPTVLLTSRPKRGRTRTGIPKKNVRVGTSASRGVTPRGRPSPSSLRFAGRTNNIFVVLSQGLAGGCGRPKVGWPRVPRFSGRTNNIFVVRLPRHSRRQLRYHLLPPLPGHHPLAEQPVQHQRPRLPAQPLSP